MIGKEIGRGAEGAVSLLADTTTKFVMTTEICSRTGSVLTRWTSTAVLKPLDLVIKHGPGVKDELGVLVTLIKKLAATHSAHIAHSTHSRATPRALLRMMELYSPFYVVCDTASILLGLGRDTVVMKRMDGTLREFYALPGVVNSLDGTRHVLDAASSVLSFLAVMHNHDTFHGDIKDDNILFSNTTGAKFKFALSDFGHMRTLRRRRMNAARSGTPGSRSPFSYNDNKALSNDDNKALFSEDNKALFSEDHIVSTATADANDLWADYAPILNSTTKRRQLVKSDVYAVGVVLARVVDPEVARLARACMFATRVHSTDEDPFWTAGDALLAVRRVMDTKRGDAHDAHLVLDPRMPGGPVVPRPRLRLRPEASLKRGETRRIKKGSDKKE